MELIEIIMDLQSATGSDTLELIVRTTWQDVEEQLMKTTWLASLLVTIFWGAVLGLVVTYLGGAMVEALTATPLTREPLKGMAVGVLLAVMSGLLVRTTHR